MNNYREWLIKWVCASYPFIAVWIGPLILIGPLLIHGQVIFWGTTYLQFLPWHLAGWEQITTGHFPLWNSFNGYGTPLLANYQSAFFYPPNILIWLMALVDGVKGIAIAQTLLVMIHLVVAGYGMIYLTMELGFSKLGQAVSAIAFSIGGYLVSRASFLSINAVLAWVPWILFSGMRIAKIPSWKHSIIHRDTLLAILFNSLLLLSGHAQLAWYAILLSIFWTATWSYYYHKFSKIFISLGILAIVMIIAGGLCAVQLIPTAEFLLQSQRAGQVEYSYALNYSIWPWRLLTIISPNLFGNPANGNYWVTADNYWEDNIYTGVITIVFGITTYIRMLLGHYREEKKWRVLVYFSLILIIISLLFALGKNTPIFPLLYQFVPTFNMFQAPARFSIWLVVMISILAGLSIDNWVKPSGKWLYWSRLLTAGAAGITITSFVIWAILKNRFQETYILGVAETGVLLTILLVINLFAPRNKDRPSSAKPLMIFCILSFLIGDLTYANWGVNPGIPIINFDRFDQSTEKTIQPEEQLLALILPDTEEEVKFSKFFRFDTYHPGIGWGKLNDYFIPNSNIYEHISSVNNFDPLVTSRYDQWSKIILPIISIQDSDINKFWGIGNVISNVGSTSEILFPQKDDQFRFRLFGCAVHSGNLQDSIQLLKQQIINGTILGRVVIEGISQNESDCLSQNSDMKIDVIKSSPSYSKIQVNTSKPGWLMQLATNYPGWKAKVDGKDVPIYFGDILFRTIYLPAGEHTIEFLFKPVSFMTGLIISIMFLILVIYFIFRSRKFQG